MKTVLLVQPGARQTIFPPIGLMNLASVLRGKYEVVIRDYSGKELDEKKIEKDIEKINPFVVGIGVLTGPPIPRALLISEIAKKLGKIVVWGGPHVTVLPEQTLGNKNIDSVVIGEGENTFQDLLKYYENKKVNLRGVGIKVKGKIRITDPNPKFVDLNKLPMPSWDLLEDIDRYFPYKRHNLLPMSTTRGCAFNCGFCHNSNKNVRRYLGCYRIAEPKQAVEEFKFVQNLVKNDIDILDVGEDLHLVSEDYTRKFCKEVFESRLGFKWYTSTRYQILNKNIINMMARYGCIRVLLGVESGSERIQKMNNKIVEFNRSVKIAKALMRRKIFVTNAYIFGHPTETVSELKKTIKFIKKIPADENLIQLYRPMPGTPYFQLCVDKKKVKVPDKLEDWGGFGVLGHDVNVSEIPDKFLFSSYYKLNAVEQSKYWINQQRFFLRNSMYEKFLRNFIDNRFTFKFKEYLTNK